MARIFKKWHSGLVRMGNLSITEHELDKRIVDKIPQNQFSKIVDEITSDLKKEVKYYGKENIKAR